MTPTQMKHIRTQMGYSKRAFADKLNVTAQTIYNWESGRRPVGQDSVYRILTMAKSQGVDTDVK